MGEKGFYSVVKGCKGCTVVYSHVQWCRKGMHTDGTFLALQCGCKGGVKGFKGVYSNVQCCTVLYSGVQWCTVVYSGVQ